MASQLTRLQIDLLQAFFRHEDRFFLAGGAALAGFHLGHRATHDLDLLTVSNALDAGEAALAIAAREPAATVEKIQTAPCFRRRLVRRGGEGVVVDLVRDELPQGPGEKPMFGGIHPFPAV